MSELALLLSEELGQPVSPEALAVAEAVRGRHGEGVEAILFYGACFREGPDPDAVLDLFVLVRDYTSVHGRGLLAFANRLLPPNVFYLEVPFSGRIVRAKYAVVTVAGFTAGTGQAQDPYFWARFAQPAALVYARTPATQAAVVTAVAKAVQRFLELGTALVEPGASFADLWVETFHRTYGGELRPEDAGRPRRLFDAFADRYRRITEAAAPLLAAELTLEPSAAGLRLQTRLSPAERRRGRLAWAFRRRYAKLLTVLRLLKAAATFTGGIDYAFWKIERHSGVNVPPRWRKGPFRLPALGLAYWRSGGAARKPGSAG